MSKIPLTSIKVFPFDASVPAKLADCKRPCKTEIVPFTFKVPDVTALNIPVPAEAPAAIMVRFPLITEVVVVVKKLTVPVDNGQL